MPVPICPRCGENVAAPLSWQVFVLGKQVTYVICSHCGCVLGIVDK